MATLKVITSDGSAAGEVEIKDSLLGVEISLACIRQCVNAYLANQRHGTVMTKNRALVRGGGAKPWKQKGTGRARAGSNRSPIWRGGGTVFGPQPRSYRKKINKKTRRLALCSVLTDKLQSDRLTIMESIDLAEGRTKALEAMLRTLEIAGKTLIITEDVHQPVVLASRNKQGVSAQVVGSLNVYELLNHDNLVVTKAAIQKMEDMWG